MRKRNGVKCYPEINKEKEAQITKVLIATGLYEEWSTGKLSAKNYKRIRAAMRRIGNVCAAYELEVEANRVSEGKLPENLQWHEVLTGATADEFRHWVLQRPDLENTPVSTQKLVVAVLPEFFKTLGFQILASLHANPSDNYKNLEYKPTVIYHGERIKEQKLLAERTYSSVDYTLYRAAIAANRIFNAFYGN